MKLEQNYRSTQTILDAAHAVVSRNAGRKDKKLWTDRGAGTQITLFDAYNEYEEAEFVARQVEKLVGGARRGSMAALLTSRADDEDGSLRYGDIAVTLPDQRPEPRDRGSVHALRHPVPARRRHALLRTARGQGRAGLPAPGPELGRPGRARADHQRAGARDRREDGRGAERVGRVQGREPLGGGRGPRTRIRTSLRARAPSSACSPSSCAGPDGDRRQRAAVGAVRRRGRAIRPPGRDPGRHGRGGGALDEPAGAARATPPSSTRSPRRRASPACWRRLRWSATRTSSRTSRTERR